MIELEPDLDLTTAQAERLLGAWLSTPVACEEIVPLQGGLVNSVFRLGFDRPPNRAVVKIHGNESDTFDSEARALHYLRTETACPVPTVYLHDSSARLIPHAFLLLEDVRGDCVHSLDLEPGDHIELDVQLADILGRLHRHKGGSWGDVETGGTSETWADLFAARLAEVRAHPALVERLGSDVLAQVDEAIGRCRPALVDCGRPTLVHGDVWDGNMIAVREHGRWQITGLLDPDLQFADAELELAYLEVFDNDREAFFAAYTTHHPLRPGYERRRLFYWLHTALVHVALFGDEFFCRYTTRIAEEIGRPNSP
ncbi:MAG: fructosamine kinase family protein [Acidimicrobiia bacterium]|nr:fructosamine kinase family protein [Acidimicrobiia bacterium]